MAFTVLEKVGIVALSYLSYVFANKLVWFLYRNYLSSKSKKIDYKSLGGWALITGSTDGVGKAYARAIAKRGCNVILVSRTESKLEEVAVSIENEFKVKTKIIVADFTETDGVYDHIEKQIMGLDIGVLVNNVGVSYPYPEYFLNLPDRELLYERIIKANVVAVTRMCSMIMPGMVERKKGLVINISSAAAIMPAPLFAVYSASKIYVDKLSRDLATVYERQGIIVQSILPGPVATKMSKINRATWMAPSPDDYVIHALNTCGKYRSSTGYFPHDILVGTIQGLEWICPRAAEWLVTKTTENIRRRALVKAKKEQVQKVITS